MTVDRKKNISDLLCLRRFIAAPWWLSAYVVVAQALSELGYELEELYEEEQDAGLGNGGEWRRTDLPKLVSPFASTTVMTRGGWAFERRDCGIGRWRCPF